MKKKKGFTLVEVLAVITILGILALITVPTIDAVIRSSREDAWEEQKDLILAAAKNWASDNVMDLPATDGETVKVTLKQLKLGGYIGIDVKNPINEECVSNRTKIVITRVGNNYTYEFEDEDNIKYNENCEVE